MTKVLESGSTSASDENYYEPSVKLRHAKTKTYKRKDHTDNVNKMLNYYLEDPELSPVDSRLIVGLASKVPTQDDDIKKKPVK